MNWSARGTEKVRGVLIQTDDEYMTSGTIKFYVDGVECPSTGGVGVNAVGGVFNCNLSGVEFKLICTAKCSPNLAITEIKLLRSQALSAEGTYYNWPGNVNNIYESSDL